MADSGGAENDDLELELEGNTGLTQPSVRKNIPLKLKGKGRGRGRKVCRTKKASSRKAGIDDGDDDDLDGGKGEEDFSSERKFELEDDISKLEMPSFTTLERGPPEPIHQSKTLKWNHKVNLIGEKVVNPMIHSCEICSLPILIYGRMIPCKHVFCSDCANKAEKLCPRCNDKIQRVEHNALGTAFICTYGGPRHGVGGCKRTYLSQRDLQAHIGHRHLRPQSNSTEGSNSSNNSSSTSTSVVSTTQTSSHNLGRDPRASHTPLPPEVVQQSAARTPPHSQHHSVSHVPHGHVPEYREPPELGRPPSILPMPLPVGGNVPPRPAHQFTHPGPAHGPTYPSPIPVVSTRSNLITVPIQDDSGAASSSPHLHPQPHLSPYASHSPSAHPPPPIQVNPYPQPSHHYQPAHPNPPYSQPPLGSQNFNPPPAHIPPPSIHNPNPPLYSPHNPPPVHHPPPPSTYNTQPVRSTSLPPPLPPQRFPGNPSYDEGSYAPPSWSSGVPPPRAHGPLPPRPIGGPHLNQPCGPGDPGYRPSYYP